FLVFAVKISVRSLLARLHSSPQSLSPATASQDESSDLVESRTDGEGGGRSEEKTPHWRRRLMYAVRSGRDAFRITRVGGRVSEEMTTPTTPSSFSSTSASSNSPRFQPSMPFIEREHSEEHSQNTHIVVLLLPSDLPMVPPPSFYNGGGGSGGGGGVRPLAPHPHHTVQIPTDVVNTIGEILDRKTSVAAMMHQTVEALNHAFELRDSSPEYMATLSEANSQEHIYQLFQTGEEEANISKLIKVLRSFGLRETDPRFATMLQKMKEFEDEDDDARNLVLTKQQFMECIHPSVQLISQALRNHLIIPSWGEFTTKIKNIFEDIGSAPDSGNVASYIPQLARIDPNIWGMSICTIDGQRFSLGDCKTNFCFQSVSKAFNYAIVASDIGTDTVHSYIGHEPSGRLFNEICLDTNGKPHNPMINAGAIIVTTLIKNGLPMADRFDFVLNEYKKLAGGEHIGFNNAVFLSERDTADRNYALSYYMKENKCFPRGTQVGDMMGLREELDLYFQLCSLETNCETAAVMAATLANGGVCPLNGEMCIQPRPCRDVLSLMYSCGMYDFSGKFAFHVGLPAKSGVSGAMIVVVPNLMGICLYSPPLDQTGNSCKGVAFCKKLIENFNFHNYDSLLHADSKKVDPRRRVTSRDTELVVSLLFAAKMGDFDAIRRMYLNGLNMEMVDYDNRTAMHVAAAEGHTNIVKFLVIQAKCNFQPRDRWGRTPLDDARQFRHDTVIAFLARCHIRYTRTHTHEGSELENGCGGTTEADEESGPSSGDELTPNLGMMIINESDMEVTHNGCTPNGRSSKKEDFHTFPLANGKKSLTIVSRATLDVHHEESESV
ncbi:glna-1, partial [Pristionchus pacificus]|uniref:glutaminase n=1 Tax=Pristionchus pacificus TaxID=54126 RepID=A0A2A6B3U5_PRIPA